MLKRGFKSRKRLANSRVSGFLPVWDALVQSDTSVKMTSLFKWIHRIIAAFSEVLPAGLRRVSHHFF